MKKIYSIIDWFLDIVLPQSCLGCKTRGVVLCDPCIATISTIEQQPQTNIFACYDYRNPIMKSVIWNLKYYNKQYVGSTLGALLYAHLIEEISDMKLYAFGRPILVIPVPLSGKRVKMRGYNQANILAKNFCAQEHTDTFVLRDDLLTKKIETLPQAKTVNRAKRLQNIRGAFEMKKGVDIRGRTIIVIDDVTTTGATLTEIMNVLTEAGAKKVVGFALAH